MHDALSIANTIAILSAVITLTWRFATLARAVKDILENHIPPVACEKTWQPAPQQ